MTPHLEFNKEDIADIVLMPGDPLRAKHIAENYLNDVKQINKVRNMFGYTGYYKGKRVSIMASGMGIPSMGIYSYELFKFYDVNKIIRIGTCGSYVDEVNLFDLLLVENSCSESTYRLVADGINDDIVSSSENITKKIEGVANQNGINILRVNIHSSDVFYGSDDNYKKIVKKYNCIGTEMETFSLFHNAKILNKEAGCILTVTDSLTKKERISTEEREKALDNMILLALNSILQL